MITSSLSFDLPTAQPFEPARTAVSQRQIGAEAPEGTDQDSSAEKSALSVFARPVESSSAKEEPAKTAPRISSFSITYKMDEETKEPYVEVVDRESGEVLRQIPAEEIRQLSELLDRPVGNVIDTTV